MKAMIFAAGRGTRLNEETENKPKALVEVGGKPLLQHAIEKLKNNGFTKIVVNVHHFSGQIISFVKNSNFGIPVIISDETDFLLDTGGGLKKAERHLYGDEPVLIYNVDILSSLDLHIPLKYHIDSGALATLVVRSRPTQRYFKFNDEKRLVGWINKKTGEEKIGFPEYFENATEMAFSGIHIVSPEIFTLLPENKKYSITGFYVEMAKEHLIKGYFDESEMWMDVGKPDELLQAREMFGLE